MALFTIYTIGSSTRQAQEFRTLLHCYHIATLVDVRTFPYSKRFPNFSKASLEEMISASGLRYVHLGRDLGGYRRGGYEAYTRTPQFAKGVDALEAIGQDARTAFMCCERLPWKCHRRFIAFELERRGWSVVHILDQGRTWQPQSVQGS